MSDFESIRWMGIMLVIFIVVFYVKYRFDQFRKPKPRTTIARDVKMPVRKKVEFRDGYYRNIDTFQRAQLITEIAKNFHVNFQDEKTGTLSYAFQQDVYLKAYYNVLADYLEDTFPGLQFLFEKTKVFEEAFPAFQDKMKSFIKTLREKAGVNQKRADTLQLTEAGLAVFTSMDPFFACFLKHPDFDANTRKRMEELIGMFHDDISALKFWKHVNQHGLQSQPVLITGNSMFFSSLMFKIAEVLTFLKFYGSASY